MVNFQKGDFLAESTDFLEEALENLSGNKVKFAVLHAGIAVEMIFKEYLVRANPILVLDDVDKVNRKFTATMKQIIPRLTNLGVDLSKHEGLVSEVIDLRNEVAHRLFKSDVKVVEKKLGQLFGFAYDFARNELDEDLKDHLPEDVYHRYKELFKEWEEIVTEAQDAASEEAQGDPKEPSEIYDCVDCVATSTVTFRDEGGFCHLCREYFKVESCERCHEIVLTSKRRNSNDGNEVFLCESCIEYYRSK